jgi:hypothetical protein
LETRLGDLALTEDWRQADISVPIHSPDQGSFQFGMVAAPHDFRLVIAWSGSGIKTLIRHSSA